MSIFARSEPIISFVWRYYLYRARLERERERRDFHRRVEGARSRIPSFSLRALEEEPWYWKAFIGRHPRLGLALWAFKRFSRIYARPSVVALSIVESASRFLYSWSRTKWGSKLRRVIIRDIMRFKRFIFMLRLRYFITKHAVRLIPLFRMNMRFRYARLSSVEWLTTYFKRVPPAVLERALSTALNVLLGKMSLSEAIEMFPEFRGLIEYAIAKAGYYPELPRDLVLVLFPQVEAITSEYLKCTVLLALIPKEKFEADPFIGRVGRVDLHYWNLIYKFPEEIIPIESTMYLDGRTINLLADEFGEAILSDDYIVGVAESTLVKSLKAIEMGQPESWAEIEEMDIGAADWRDRKADYLLRRKSFNPLARTILEYLGFRW